MGDWTEWGIGKHASYHDTVTQKIVYCIVTISKFARGYGCASEFRLRLEGLRQVRHAQDGCTAPPALYPDTGEVGGGTRFRQRS